MKLPLPFIIQKEVKMLRTIFVGLSNVEALRKFATKNKIARKTASRFIAGEELKEGIEAAKKLNLNNIEVTMDFLGENTKTEEEAWACAKEITKIMDAIKREKILGNVSIKPTQLGLDLGEEFCEGVLRFLFEEAKNKNIFVRIDMEGSPYTQKTLNLFYKLYEEYKNIGIVIQAYLYRSFEDVEKILSLGARIRLCKGAYKEPPEIAYKKMKEIRENFLQICKLLFENGNYPAIATHDTYLINSVKKMAKEMGKSPKDFEFQMLFGIRPKTQERLAQEGYRMRVYVPFGTHWLPYFYRRLRERKENIFFVVKNLFKR